MSQPFSGMPDPGTPRPFKRRLQPGVVVQDALRTALHRAQWYCEKALRGAQRHGDNLWRRGKRNPRTFALIGGLVAVTLVGSYALSASGRSLCPVTSGGKSAEFRLLMDPVLHAAAGSELEIHYDVCGLPSGTPYRGQVRLSQQRPAKKVSSKPKPLVIMFKGQVDGPATRREQEVNLGSTKPGTYSLELSVTDNRGRERKRVEKVLIKAR